jgi:hypothetical protein
MRNDEQQALKKQVQGEETYPPHSYLDKATLFQITALFLKK